MGSTTTLSAAELVVVEPIWQLHTLIAVCEIKSKIQVAIGDH